MKILGTTKCDLIVGRPYKFYEEDRNVVYLSSIEQLYPNMNDTSVPNGTIMTLLNIEHRGFNIANDKVYVLKLFYNNSLYNKMIIEGDGISIEEIV
jgi:hypothetical protein